MSQLLTKSRNCCTLGHRQIPLLVAVVLISHIALTSTTTNQLLPGVHALAPQNNEPPLEASPAAAPSSNSTSAPESPSSATSSTPATGAAAAATSSETAESGALPGQGGLVTAVASDIRPNEDPQNIRTIVARVRANELDTEIVSNKTRVMVSCDAGEMLVRINFTEPFRGLGFADYDASSPCRIDGTGERYYELKLPLRGCGTKQVAPRIFTNDIILRYHRSLQLEEDEVRTVVCKYPPPLAPAPPQPQGPPARLLLPPVEPARLTQYEPFVLIAGLLFFALLLAGVGTTSYVTRQQKFTEINTPLPITAHTEYDTYLDKESIITTEDITTTQKLAPPPPVYSTHTVDDVFITNIHEVDTEEHLTHHKRQLERPHHALEHYEDTYITNEHDIVCEETLERARLAADRPHRLDCQDYEDTYVTNQDELEEDERLTHYRMQTEPAKLEVRTIEDTFITNVDEIVEKVDTTYHKSHPTSGPRDNYGYEVDEQPGGSHVLAYDDHRGERHQHQHQQQQRAGEHFEEFESRLENLRRQQH